MPSSNRALIIAILGAMAVSLRAVPPERNQSAVAGESAMVKVENPAAAPERFREGFETITSRASRTLLSFLASDSLEGRETGSRGYRLAADYAASLFALWGVEPAVAMGSEGERGYRQQVVMKEYADLGCNLTWREAREGTARERTFREGIDLENYYRNRVPETVSAPVVFAGYGMREESIGYDDFAGIDVKGKIVMILDEVPGRDDPASPFMKPELVEKFRSCLSPPGGFNKAAEIAKLGPAAVLVARNSIKGGDIEDEAGRAEPNDDLPIIAEPASLSVLPGARRQGGAIFITRETADAVLSLSGQSIESLQARISARWKPASFEILGGELTIRTTAGSERLVRSHNVIGLVPGSDPRLRDEAVIVGAHLDHLGRRDAYVFNGADDNASGAAGVLEIARAVAAMPVKPKRTVVFCLWTGEEQGLLGSTFYAAHPVFPMDRTTAYLNLDMIGRAHDRASLEARMKRLRIPAGEQKDVEPGNFAVAAFSAGHGLSEILGRADQAAGLDLWRKAEAAVKSAGIVSDYLPFAAAHVPYIYWEGVIHEDYHRTSDEAGKIDFELMAKTIRLAYLTATALAETLSNPRSRFAGASGAESPSHPRSRIAGAFGADK